QALLHAIAATEPQPGRTELGPLLDGLMRPPRRRGLVVVISDFLPGSAGASRQEGGRSPALPWQRSLARLGVRHDLLAVEVVDPRELELPPVGVLEVVDPETGDVHEVDVTERLAEAYAQEARRQRDEVAAVLRSAGAAHLRLRTDRDWLLDLVSFVSTRRIRRIRAA
ncbi:MAG: DUF58 domain-containing protein, partial [Hamadaea sp.]|nr:DUF58 domain-containing protein [Hamadaea sp.]